MVDRRFCNYNLDYQQRLGFLKIVAQIGAQARGGVGEILVRLKDIYPEAGRSHHGPLRNVGFNPDQLLRKPEIPSWQPGFSAKRLDRLVLWAEMLGIIAPTGRLSGWATILRGLGRQKGIRDTIKANPFMLTLGEKALFTQLLLYHDQVLPFLLRRISETKAGVRLNLHKCCILTIRSIGEFLDDIAGQSANEIQLRVEVRDVLERIAAQYGVRNPKAMQSAISRSEILDELEHSPTRKKRPHLAEYHTVCRFEQLTDLGLLMKEDPENPPANESERAKLRTAWSWITTSRSVSLGDIMGAEGNLEGLLERRWIDICSRTMGRTVARLDPYDDQIEIAQILDDTLPLARRQIGPIQLHTWATAASARAFENGFRIEISDVVSLFDAVQRDKFHGQRVRVGGRDVFRGRTVTVPSDGIVHLLQMHPVQPGGGK